MEDDLDEPIKVDCINAIKELDFSECEELGVNTPKKCNRYLNCQTCTITEEGRTIQEQFELDLMKQNIWWDEDAKCVTVSYPTIGDMSLYQDNRWQAIQRATSLRRSLNRKGVLTAYNEQVEDYINRNVWEETTIDDVMT